MRVYILATSMNQGPYHESGSWYRDLESARKIAFRLLQSRKPYKLSVPEWLSVRGAVELWGNYIKIHGRQYWYEVAIIAREEDA